MTKILVIEDGAALREEIVEWLQFEAYTVYGAANGREGVRLALQHLPDLIISDVLMPGLDGHRVLLELRSHAATALTPFIFLTALADRRDIRRGMNLGADDYLTKPFSREDLLETIRSRISKHAANRQRSAAELDELRQRVIHTLPHELRTPLAGIMGYAELLTLDPASYTPAEITEMALAIQRSGERLLRLIDNYLLFVQLDLLRAQSLVYEPSDNPATLIAQTAKLLAQNYARAGDLHLALTDARLAINAESFGKIVYELVDNAFKFSQPGHPVRVTCRTEGDYYALTIRDAGRGIAPEHIQAISAFGQFERDVYEQQGSGLGLIIAQRLAELYGGRLTIESQISAGTTVRVQIPLAPTPSNEASD